MDWFSFSDYFRILMALIALTATILSSVHAYRNWNKYTDRWKGLWWALNVYNLAVVEGAIEQIVRDIPWGPRTILGFCAASACLLAQLRNEGYEKKPAEVNHGESPTGTEDTTGRTSGISEST